MPLGKRINAIQKRLAVFEIADNDDNLKQSGARKDGDLSDSPRVALDKTLHCSLSYSTEDILHAVEPAHTVEHAGELLVVEGRAHVGLVMADKTLRPGSKRTTAIETLVKTFGPDDTLLLINSIVSPPANFRICVASLSKV